MVFHIYSKWKVLPLFIFTVKFFYTKNSQFTYFTSLCRLDLTSISVTTKTWKWSRTDGPQGTNSLAKERPGDTISPRYNTMQKWEFIKRRYEGETSRRRFTELKICDAEQAHSLSLLRKVDSDGDSLTSSDCLLHNKGPSTAKARSANFERCRPILTVNYGREPERYKVFTAIIKHGHGRHLRSKLYSHHFI